MKRTLLTVTILALALLSAGAKTPGRKYVEASDLTLVGKLFPNTPNPYHRVDTCIYKGFTNSENLQVRESSGISVAFKTNSSYITLVTDFAYYNESPSNITGYASRGYDLYIREGGKWVWAASCDGVPKKGDEVTIIRSMDGSEKECLLYLPLFAELSSVQIGVQKNATIEAAPNPFRYRIGIFGSSYTHGASTSRSGMPYPAQLSRFTGLQFLSLGCSGNSKLQPYFARALAAADVDALVFDSFSNPSAEMIEERLFSFIETIQESHPDIPLIFMQTIQRPSREFNSEREKFEADKMEMADRLMKQAVKKYKNVYWIPETKTWVNDEYMATVDGTHPDDYGYYLWAKSVEKPIVKILSKYGIK